METTKIYSVLKTNSLVIVLLSTLIGALCLGVSLILPNQYTAEGLIIVTRATEIGSGDVFLYEGYYAQQNAQNYLATFQSIVESPGNIKNALKISDGATEKIARLVSVQRAGSQSLSLKVKGASPSATVATWDELVASAIETHTKHKDQADPLITMYVAAGSPVVTHTYPAWYKVFGLGFSIALVLTCLVSVSSAYLKEER